MPYIQLRTSKEITREKEKLIKERLGESIELIGKTEEWLMVEFVSNAHLYFRGEENISGAYVEVKIFGTCDNRCYQEFTKQVCQILNEELGLKPENIYISYGEYHNWGWNGSNF